MWDHLSMQCRLFKPNWTCGENGWVTELSNSGNPNRPHGGNHHELYWKSEQTHQDVALWCQMECRAVQNYTFVLSSQQWAKSSSKPPHDSDRISVTALSMSSHCRPRCWATAVSEGSSYYMFVTWTFASWYMSYMNSCLIWDATK